MRRRAAVMAALLLLPCAPAAGERVLVQDPLDGATAGVQDGGGEFVAGGGWRSTGGKIVYDAGALVTDGWFECTMRGWTAPAAGIDKSHPLSGWEVEGEYGHHVQTGSFWNWRIGEGYNPFKVLAAPQAIATRVEARVGSNDAVNGADAHTYRVEWHGGTVAFIFDGATLHEWTFARFALRYFLIGKDDQYGIADPAPVISNVTIVDAGGAAEPEPETAEAAAEEEAFDGPAETAEAAPDLVAEEPADFARDAPADGGADPGPDGFADQGGGDGAADPRGSEGYSFEGGCGCLVAA